MLPQASADFFRAQQSLTALSIASVRRSWARMGGGSFNASWTHVGPNVLVMLLAAQLSAARRADAYVADVLQETGQRDEPAGQFAPQSLVGVASDGRPLDSLLYGSVVQSAQAYNTGSTESQALSQGLSWLEGVVTTQIADVGRMGTGVGIAARPHSSGYVRMLKPPSCSRCAILAGKWFKWNRGFLRHPRCDCIHIPASEAMHGDLTTSPNAYFKSLSPADQERLFTKDGAQAIRDGADMGQVVNARTGMGQTQIYGHDIKYTTTGSTRRGEYGRNQTQFVTKNLGKRGYIKNYRERRAAVPRLMPESIYQHAVDRADAIRLLKKYGYIY